MQPKIFMTASNIVHLVENILWECVLRDIVNVHMKNTRKCVQLISQRDVLTVMYSKIKETGHVVLTCSRHYYKDTFLYISMRIHE